MAQLRRCLPAPWLHSLRLTWFQIIRTSSLAGTRAREVGVPDAGRVVGTGWVQVSPQSLE